MSCWSYRKSGYVVLMLHIGNFLGVFVTKVWLRLHFWSHDCHMTCFLGEDFWNTAMRETLEETGIKTEFVSVLAFRHSHEYTWGIDDLYFVCLLRPLNTDIHANSTEIAAAKWIDVRIFCIIGVNLSLIHI